MSTGGARTVAGSPAGWRRLMFPESWPVALRAAGLLAIATFAAFGPLRVAPWLDQDFIRLRATLAQPLAGWPVTNLSIGLDYASTGFDSRLHQIANLGLHFLGALLLFVLLHFALTRQDSPAGRAAFFPALGGALLWLLHPLQTDALPGLAGRGPLLAGVMLLFTLWAFAAGTRRCSGMWRLLAVAGVVAGMATHGLMLAAPWMLLLFDRAFLATSWRDVWKQRAPWHVAFLGSSVVGLYFVVTAAPVAGADEFTSALSASEVLGRQLQAAGWYLQRAFWPQSPVYDYGPGFVPAGTALTIAATIALVGVTFIGLARRPAWGFVASLFWLTLAFAGWGAGQWGAIDEARLHVPLLALAMAAAFGVARFGRAGGIALVILACGLGVGSQGRTAVHANAVALWSDTVTQVPSNARARFELGQALAAAGRVDDALEQFDLTVQLVPKSRQAHLQLAGLLVQAGRVGEAVAEYETSLRLDPNSVAAHLGLAAVQFRLGRTQSAQGHYEAASRLGVSAAEGQRHYGRALAEAGRLDEALHELESAAKLAPADADTRLVLGIVLSAAGRPEEGSRQFFAAVALQPDNPDAHAALGDALMDDHRPSEALAHYETALRLQPGRSAPLHASMGTALILLGRAPEAIAAYELALRGNPDDTATRTSLERVRAAAARHGGRKN